MEQTTLFDQEPDAPIEPTPPPKRMTLHGESRDGIGMLEADIVGWSFSDGIWWITHADGHLTGYNFSEYLWLSLRPQEES